MDRKERWQYLLCRFPYDSTEIERQHHAQSQALEYNTLQPHAMDAFETSPDLVTVVCTCIHPRTCTHTAHENMLINTH
jgi:hypothetical protein